MATTWKTRHVLESHIDFYEHNMQGLVHLQWKCTANGGYYVEKHYFCSWQFALSNGIVVFFASIFSFLGNKLETLHSEQHMCVCDMCMYWRVCIYMEADR